MTLPGYATREDTTTYQQRFSSTLAPAHFRESLGLKLSSIGFGTYLGEADDATDAQYAEAISRVLARGCNVLDTAINYRHQRSECGAIQFHSTISSADANPDLMTVSWTYARGSGGTA